VIHQVESVRPVVNLDRAVRGPEDRSPKGLRVQSAQEEPEALEAETGRPQHPAEVRDEPGKVKTVALIARKPLYDRAGIGQHSFPLVSTIT